jgi:hypothetical protein
MYQIDAWERSILIDAMGIKLFGWSSSWSENFERELSSFNKNVEEMAEDNYYTPDLTELYSKGAHFIWLWGPYAKGHRRQLNKNFDDKAVMVGHAVLPITARLSSSHITPGKYALTKEPESSNTLVSGEIWMVTPEVVTQLDFNESNTIVKERELHNVWFAGKDYPCWVYFDKKPGFEVNMALDKAFVSSYEMSLKRDPKRKFTVFYTRKELIA